jgi:hypothetical protein
MGDAMGQRLPRGAVITLVLLAIGSFAFSMYLEQYQLVFLQTHPISVNLLSGVTGFSVGLLTLGLAFGWLKEREHLLNRRIQLSASMASIYVSALELLLKTGMPFRPAEIVRGAPDTWLPRARRQLVTIASSGLAEPQQIDDEVRGAASAWIKGQFAAALTAFEVSGSHAVNEVCLKFEREQLDDGRYAISMGKRRPVVGPYELAEGLEEIFAVFLRERAVRRYFKICKPDLRHEPAVLEIEDRHVRPGGRGRTG